jgi:hypothetical protein
MDKQYYDNKLAEIPKDFLDEVIEFLQKVIFVEEEEKKEIREAFISEGEIKWALEHHFGWGMEMRNILRANGFMDNKLPDNNWDDYYIQVIELALGLRESSENNAGTS